jgi:hypothetical protein
MKTKPSFRLLVGILFCYCSLLPTTAFAVYLQNPAGIEVEGFVSFGEDGAAWLKAEGWNMLVTAGYAINKNLRVTAIRHEGVVLYQTPQNRYIVVTTAIPDAHRRHHPTVLWSMPMPLWKTVRLIALAYRKDYICHSETRMEVQPRTHVQSLEQMMARAVSPHHRYHGRDGILYVSPVHVRNTDWTWFNKQVRTFRSQRLIEWFSALGRNGTLVMDNKDIKDVLVDIQRKTGVPIFLNNPLPIKVFCSFKDRPWHEILANILLFNGLSLSPSQSGLTVIQGWR